MNYRKLDDVRFVLFSYGLLLLGLLFVLESLFSGLERYAWIRQVMAVGGYIPAGYLVLPAVLLTLKFFAGVVFLYIALEELKITRIEETIVKLKHKIKKKTRRRK